MKKIESLEQLLEHYSRPLDRALWKEIPFINEHYRQFIEKAPFLIMATQGEHGIDCSPRGDPAGFVRVIGQSHIQIPDRRGNNRLDSLKNILHNPAVGLIFIVPNVGETIRVSGQAEILIDDKLCQSFAINGSAASSVISIRVDKAYYQCAKAIVRSKLWDSSTYPARTELPSVGQMSQYFHKANQAEFDVERFETDYPDYIRKTIY